MRPSLVVLIETDWLRLHAALSWSFGPFPATVSVFVPNTSGQSNSGLDATVSHANLYSNHSEGTTPPDRDHVHVDCVGHVSRDGGAQAQQCPDQANRGCTDPAGAGGPSGAR